MERDPSLQLTSLEHLFFDMEASGFNSDVSSLQFYELESGKQDLQQASRSQTEEAAFAGLEAQQLYQHLCCRIERTPEFRQKLFKVPLGLDHPYWTEDFQFDLQDHFQHLVLEPGADWDSLMQAVSRLQSQPLTKNRPLWTGAVISGFAPVSGLEGAQVALYLKMHHSLLDGETGRSIQKALHGFEPQSYQDNQDTPEQPPLDSGSLPGEDPSRIKAMAKSYPNNIRKTMRSVDYVKKEWVFSPAKFGKDLFQKANTARKNVRMGPLGLRQVKKGLDDFLGVPTVFNPRQIGKESRVDGKFFPLADLKKLQLLVEEATLTDVVFAIIGGGIRRYLDNRSESVRFPLNVAVPVSIRDDSGSASRVMLTVHFSELFSNIKDPLKRLQKTTRRNRAMKQSSSLQKSRTLMGLLQETPLPVSSPLVKLAAWSLGKSPLVGAHTAITSVPGVPVQLYLGKSRLVGMMGMAPIVGRIGLVHGVFSTADTISISVTAGSKVQVDTGEYLSAIEESYQQYLSLCP